MKSNYKRLGDYIQPVNIRNEEDKKDNLLGVSVAKCFITSVANTIGTNFKRYKVVKRNQFTYIPDTSRRGDKIGIALLEDYDEAIVSQAYTVFEVKDKNELHPEYLMMWFRRPEFDRYARFKSHGSVREIFDWDEMCDTELPLPSIEKQRAIVAEYNTVKNRIALNKQLIQKLEEAAQTIYKQWFVDFEFPFDFAQGKPNEDCKPYKSSGGKMVYCDELEKEIPEGWKSRSVYETCLFYNGAAFKEKGGSQYKQGLPIIKIAELKAGITEQTSYTTNKMALKHLISNGDLLYSWSGNPHTSLEVFKWFRGDAILNQHIFKLDFHQENSKIFVYNLLKYLKPIFVGLAEGKQTTGLGHVTVADLKRLTVAYPSITILSLYNKINRSIYNLHSDKIMEQIKLDEIKNILHSKLATE